MSTHDTLFADQGFPLLIELQGEQITYTPNGGAATTPDALVGKEVSQEVEQVGDGERTKKITRTVTLAVADVTGGINATVTIDSVEYEVDAIAAAAAGYVTLTLARNVAMEKARKMFRGNR